MKSIPLVIAGLLVSLGATAADIRTITLDVTNMDCAACPITVRKALEKVPGVDSVKVNFKTKRAVVELPSNWKRTRSSTVGFHTTSPPITRFSATESLPGCTKFETAWSFLMLT